MPEPFHAEESYQLGLSCLNQGKPDEAEEHFRMALGERPNWAAAVNQLGLALAAQGRDGEAIEAFRQATALAPDDPDGLLNLGTLLRHKGMALSSVQGPVWAEIAPGELLDKITILEIKQNRTTDEAKLRNIRRELGALNAVRGRVLGPSAELDRLTAELKAVNEKLWDIEDDIRRKERDQDFGPTFIALARAVYHNNDHRAALKRKINELLDSPIIEEKTYVSYVDNAAF